MPEAAAYFFAIEDRGTAFRDFREVSVGILKAGRKRMLQIEGSNLKGLKLWP